MPASPPAFIEVYRPASHAELALIRPALEQAGIQYYVKNEFASLGARAATGADELSLMVPPAQCEAAQQLIADIVR
ncbi:MAG: DUF2007 domain-containing protein [Gemmatimonadota bacterium]|nr:DUF2007 domain-containing protein [Gemmatimonadota bacterium]MDH5197381.1 DUF2007 domain-containing protein [Gemmatimonadota bacterium]